MRLKCTPATGPRYWTGLCLASMVGCNLGDVIPDILHVSAVPGLMILAVLFAATFAADRRLDRGNETFYWLAILIARAAATNIADVTIGEAHKGYLAVSLVLAALLAGLVTIVRPPASLPRGLPSSGVRYWVTMLVAGTLGTVMADGIGHAIHPINVGVPTCAVGASVVLGLALLARRELSTGAAVFRSYWAVVVLVRVWGTSTGDIAAFALSLPVSLLLTAAIMTIALLAWRKPQGGITRRPANAL